MTLPILIDHDPQRVIGIVDVADNAITIALNESVRLTRDQLFDVFGNIGVRIIDSVRDGDTVLVKKAQILEFSVPMALTS